MSSERKEIITLVNEACVSGARQSNACECIGISAKTFQRWCRPDNARDGRLDCVFHAKPATDSRASLPPIPDESCH
jgi:hypothetical protein